jgi:hypothetical protein
MNAHTDTWMGDIDPCIRYRRLSDILIPGSHDSVTYNLKFPIAAGFAQTQNQTLEEQLNDGVRAFDIRVSYFTTGNFGANWYAQHGGIQDVTLTFGQIITSLGNWAIVAGREQEIIMLNLSLQNNPDDPFPVNLCATIGEDWGKNLVTPDMLLQQLNTADPGEPIFDQLWRLPQSFRGARIIIDNLECLTHATGNVAQWGPISPPNTSFITAYYPSWCDAGVNSQLVNQAAATRGTEGPATLQGGEALSVGPPVVGGLYWVQVSGTPLQNTPCILTPFLMLDLQQDVWNSLKALWDDPTSTVRDNLNVVAGDFVSEGFPWLDIVNMNVEPVLPAPR